LSGTVFIASVQKDTPIRVSTQCHPFPDFPSSERHFQTGW
jgi:hypothetical protein